MSSVADSKEWQGLVLSNTPRMAMFLWEINRVGENDGPKSIGSAGRKSVALIQLNYDTDPTSLQTKLQRVSSSYARSFKFKTLNIERFHGALVAILKL